MTRVPEEMRRALCSEEVDLNGVPATISGWREPFACITQRGTGLSAQWSWEAVVRIVGIHRRFET